MVSFTLFAKKLLDSLIDESPQISEEQVSAEDSSPKPERVLSVWKRVVLDHERYDCVYNFRSFDEKGGLKGICLNLCPARNLIPTSLIESRNVFYFGVSCKQEVLDHIQEIFLSCAHLGKVQVLGVEVRREVVVLVWVSGDCRAFDKINQILSSVFSYPIFRNEGVPESIPIKLMARATEYFQRINGK